MPNNANSAKEYVDREALIRMYTESWGFSKKDAEEEADKIIARGPSSPIYQARMELARNRLPPDDKVFDVEKAPFPESAMANPEMVDPRAQAAQRVLNERRAQVGSVPTALESSKPDVSLNTMYDFYRNGLGLDPKSALDYAAEQYKRGQTAKAYGNQVKRAQLTSPMVPVAQANPESVMADPRFADPQAYAAQQALNERRAKLQADAQVPISPAPLKPAAATPQHLEDANLSSWQSLANLLGY